MFGNVPDGTGCVMLDAGYDAVKNYKMIRDAGRRPVICTRRNYVARGFGPRAEMIRWQEKNPEEFEETYHRRSVMESVFAALQMYGDCTRCRRPDNRTRKISIRATTSNSWPDHG